MCHLGGKQTQHPSIHALKTCIFSFNCGLRKESWGMLTGQVNQILLALWIIFSSVLMDLASHHHLISFITKWNIAEISDIHIPSVRECALCLLMSPFYQVFTAETWSPKKWLLKKKRKLFTLKKASVICPKAHHEKKKKDRPKNPTTTKEKNKPLAIKQVHWLLNLIIRSEHKVFLLRKLGGK